MGFNVKQIEFDLNTQSLDDPEKAAKSVAANLDNYEDLLLQSFSAKDDYESLKPIAEKLGMDVFKRDANGKLTKDPADLKANQVQIVAQTKYEKAMRLYSAFAQIMSQANQMLMNVINKIGK